MVKERYRKVNLKAAYVSVARMRAWKHEQSYWRVTNFSLTADP